MLAAIVAAYVYFHTPDGGLVAFNAGGGQVIVRPVLAGSGYAGKTMIQTGIGNIVVTETACEVTLALGYACPPTNAPIKIGAGLPPAIPLKVK
jgi:hypothetical protein